MERKIVKAVCIVEIQVACDDTWSDDTTMAQIVDQARKSATGRVYRMFEECGADDKDLRCKRSGDHGISLIGVKKIVTQVVSES